MKPKFPCKICSKPYKSRAILCNLCNHWIHAGCTDLSAEQFNKLGSSDTPFYCSLCVCSLFPFAKLNNSQFISVTKYNPFLKALPSNKAKPKHPCKHCYKSCRANQKCICCDICNIWCHFNCTSMTLSQFNDFADNSSMPYFCSPCMSDILPINCLESRDHCKVYDSKDYLSLSNVKDHFNSCSFQSSDLIILHCNVRSLIKKH